MIWMKSQLKAISLFAIYSLATSAHALDTFECVRGLMGVTEHANLQLGRRGVEKPFFEGDYMVFPEVSKRKLAGFFIYRGDKAWHYDAVENLKHDNAMRRFSLLSAPFK
jgi:hypothetical protein